jgi:hypothetical protein
MELRQLTLTIQNIVQCLMEPKREQLIKNYLELLPGMTMSGGSLTEWLIFANNNLN